MVRPESDRVRQALQRIVLEGITPYRAARDAGIQLSTIYRAQKRLDRTIQIVKWLQALKKNPTGQTEVEIIQINLGCTDKEARAAIKTAYELMGWN